MTAVAPRSIRTIFHWDDALIGGCASSRAAKKEIIVINLLLYNSAFHHLVAANRERHEIENAGEFWFCSAEDLIVMKLIANRDQDQSDIRAILRLRGDVLDFDYVERWAERFGKVEVWEKRLSEWQASST